MDVVAYAVIIGPPVAWLVVILLWWVSRIDPDGIALRERLATQVVLAIMASLWGVMGWVYLGVLDLDPGAASVLFVALALLPSLPGLWLLGLFAFRRFRDGAP